MCSYTLQLNIRYTYMQSSSMDQQAAKAAAKRIYQKVNLAGGPLQSYQISSLMTHTYDHDAAVKPTSRDIKSYKQVLDANRDGEVTLCDIETLAIQYLCGAGVLANQLSTAYKTTINPSTNNYSRDFTNSQSNYSTAAIQNKTQYTQHVKQYIASTKAIFQRHADLHFTITADRVPQLLAQSYQVLGRKGFKLNEQDVKGWMNLCDGNGDGHVQYNQFEYFIVRSLQRLGLPLYK